MLKRMIMTSGFLLGIAFCAHAEDSFPSVFPEPVETSIWKGQFLKQNNAASFVRVSSDTLPSEGYILNVTDKGTTVSASSESGFFYAAQTLRQLATDSGYPVVSITDFPRFPWRAALIDPARNFWPVKDIKTFIDIISFYKFNKLHIHLTDDQGWRLVSDKWPKLATVASTRSGGIGKKSSQSGYYTKAELKDLVRYAQDRHVELIPEIDMPGHSQSAITAYPELTCFPEQEYKVKTDVGVSKILVCPAKAASWKFYNDILDEVIEIFPSSYVHIGGDEAPTDRWKICPDCTKLRQEKRLKNTHQQLEWFFDNVSKMLEKRGKKTLMWYEEEIKIYPKNALVYTWRWGRTPAVIDKSHAANLKLILAPGEFCYLDYPLSRTSLEKAFAFDPDYGLPDSKRDHIVGIEFALWGEAIADMKQAVFMGFPRAWAIAEAAWTPKSKRSDWRRFQEKVKVHEKILAEKMKD